MMDMMTNEHIDFSDFSVSPRSKSFFLSFFDGLLFDLGACWDKDLDQGLTIHVTMNYRIILHCLVTKG